MLEMGEPVKIIDLARDMIRLSGLEPDRDIAIEVIGPRPGEKLHEELFNPYERPQPTPAQKILRAEHPRPRSRVGAGDVRPGQLARAGRRRGRAGGQGGGALGRPPGAARARSEHRRGRRFSEQPGRRLESTARSPWSCSPSRSRTRSRSTAPTSASPPSSAWPCSRCCTSRRLASSSACASGRSARPSARSELEQRVVAQATASVARRAPAHAGGARGDRPRSRRRGGSPRCPRRPRRRRRRDRRPRSPRRSRPTRRRTATSRRRRSDRAAACRAGPLPVERDRAGGRAG